jgi:protein tyrosine phosphatase (PTP) superfamily phosphohydrolase (DUF442 family)
MARLNYSRLSDRLLAGAMPHAAEHVSSLQGEGVVVVINLCEEREYWDGERETVMAAYAASGITELHLPVKDGATVPHEVIDAAVAGMAAGVAYVHCRGGRERSGSPAGLGCASHLTGSRGRRRWPDGRSRMPSAPPCRLRGE